MALLRHGWCATGPLYCGVHPNALLADPSVLAGALSPLKNKVVHANKKMVHSDRCARTLVEQDKKSIK